MITRPCTRCKITKPLSEFGKSKKGKYGHRERCKDCRREVRQIARAAGHRDPYELRMVNVDCEGCEQPYETRYTAHKQAIYEGLTFLCDGCRHGYVPYNQIRKSLHLKRGDRIIKQDPNLTVEFIHDLWIMQEGKCWYTGIPMIFPIPQKRNTKSQNNPIYTASLDRIDSSKDYTTDNVVICTMTANLAKSDLSEEQFMEWIAALRKVPNEL